jgi:hypothetical protein
LYSNLGDPLLEAALTMSSDLSVFRCEFNLEKLCDLVVKTAQRGSDVQPGGMMIPIPILEGRLDRAANVRPMSLFIVCPLDIK